MRKSWAKLVKYRQADHSVKKRATAERWEIQVLRILRWQSWDKILGGFQNQHVRKEKINAHFGKHHKESNNVIDPSAGARKL